VLYLGKIMEISSKKKLFEKPLHPYSKALLSAVPKVQSKNTNKILLKGDIPSPINPPSGCVFRTRCNYAIKQCSEIVPLLKEVDGDRKVACIRDEIW
jgi:oligopeptide/dipeptide ABC transporter ATP-binding protein